MTTGDGAESVQRKPQAGGEETEGRTGLGSKGPEEGRVSSTERRERHPTSRTSKNCAHLLLCLLSFAYLFSFILDDENP